MTATLQRFGGLLDEMLHTVNLDDIIETYISVFKAAQCGWSSGAGGLGEHVHAFEIGAGRIQAEGFVDYARELIRAGRGKQLHAG